MPSGGADQKGHFAEPAYRKIAATTGVPNQVGRAGCRTDRPESLRRHQ